MIWISALLCGVGIFLILSSKLPSLYAPARKALRFRAPKRLTQSQVLQNQLAEKIEPMLDLDPIKRSGTELLLQSLGHPETPELFCARAIAKSVFMAGICSVLLFLSVPLGLFAMLCIAVSYYKQQTSSLEKELAEKRAAIERELPQFASTICQSLGTTHEVSAILRSYRRVCGPTLAGEIDKTLNDIVTGNAERAIRALESRIASPKLGQITRGLLAVMRGDDQRQYFSILADELRRSQDEAVERELLQRPQKLYPYMGALFVFFILMIGISLGADLINSFKALS